MNFEIDSIMKIKIIKGKEIEAFAAEQYVQWEEYAIEKLRQINLSQGTNLWKSFLRLCDFSINVEDIEEIHISDLEFFSEFYEVFAKHGLQELIHFKEFAISGRRSAICLFNLMPHTLSVKSCLEEDSIVLDKLLNVTGVLKKLPGLFYDQVISRMDKEAELHIYGNSVSAPAIVQRKYSNELMDLDGLEPQVIRIDHLVETKELDLETEVTKETWSFSELNSTMDFIVRAYSNLKMKLTEEVGFLQRFIESLRPFCEDDFNIEIPEKQIQNLGIPDELFIKSNDFVSAMGEKGVLYFDGAQYYTSVPIIYRYIYSFISDEMKKDKGFQIRSGFVFEDQVTNTLKSKGFERVTIKRINRKEFDVICWRKDELYHFQCKNNFIENYNLGKSVKDSVSKNRSLINSYKRAYKKEINREHLLIKKFNVSKVNHFIICRFPVYNNLEYLITFNKLKGYNFN